MKIKPPTTPADAIRVVCYVRAWRVRRLAREIGADESWLSKVLLGKAKGSDKLLARIMKQMPKGGECI